MEKRTTLANKFCYCYDMIDSHSRQLHIIYIHDFLSFSTYEPNRI